MATIRSADELRTLQEWLDNRYELFRIINNVHFRGELDEPSIILDKKLPSNIARAHYVPSERKIGIPFYPASYDGIEELVLLLTHEMLHCWNDDNQLFDDTEDRDAGELQRIYLGDPERKEYQYHNAIFAYGAEELGIYDDDYVLFEYKQLFEQVKKLRPDQYKQFDEDMEKRFFREIGYGECVHPDYDRIIETMNNRLQRRNMGERTVLNGENEEKRYKQERWPC